MTTAKTGGGGVFGSIKSLFVEEVPDVAKPVPAQTAPSAIVGSIGISPTGPILPPPTAWGPDPAALAKLEGKLNAAVPPVYAAFMEQYEGLRDVIPDEGMRFQAALRTSKASIPQLAEAIDTLVGVMIQAQAEFDKGYQDTLGRTQTAITQGIETNRAAIQQHQATIASLQATINQLHAEEQAAQEKLAVEQRRLESIRGGFAAAYAQVLGRLNAQKAHIASQKV